MATQLEKSAPAIPDKTLANGLSTVWVRARVWWASLQAAQRSWAVVSLVLLMASAFTIVLGRDKQPQSGAGRRTLP